MPLVLTHMPITISFGVFDRYLLFMNPGCNKLTLILARTHLISDPSSFEEPLLDASINVIIDVLSGTLGGINQVGFSTPSTTLDAVTQRAIVRSKILAEILIQSKVLQL